MKYIIVLITAISLSGCATNGNIDYGKTALLVGSIALAASLSSSGDSTDKTDCYIVVGPNGSDQVCR